MAFQKGKSGNPGGRPKQVMEVLELAREKSVEAIETLTDIMRNGIPDAARTAAATAILDRGLGKPTQPLEHSGPDGEALLVQINVTPVDPLALTDGNPED